MFQLKIAFSLFTMVSGTVSSQICTTHTDFVSVTPTDWSVIVTIPKFDPALGVLSTVTFDMTGHIEGEAFYENFEAMDTDVSLTLSAAILLMRPDLTTLLTVAPSVTVMENPAGYDGVWDFDGPSGSTFSALSTNATVSMTSPPPLSDLVLFTGLGNILLPISATANSTGAGPGNWVFGFSTLAGAEVDVTYCYIPEPTTAALLTLGAFGTVVRRRRS